jgi:hypothetical protein
MEEVGRRMNKSEILCGYGSSIFRRYPDPEWRTRMNKECQGCGKDTDMTTVFLSSVTLCFKTISTSSAL